MTMCAIFLFSIISNAICGIVEYAEMRQTYHQSCLHQSCLLDDARLADYKTFFASCPVEYMFNPDLFKNWCENRIEYLLKKLVSDQEAFENLFENQKDFIAKVLPEYPFLLKKETYLTPVNLPGFECTHSIQPWLKLLLIVDFVHHPEDYPQKNSSRSTQYKKADIVHTLNNQDLNELFTTEYAAQLLSCFQLLKGQKSHTLAILEEHDTHYTLIDYILLLSRGKNIIPTAPDFTNCHNWSAHNGGALSAWGGIVGHDILNHALENLIAGEMCNSAFFNPSDNQGVLQTLAQKLLKRLQCAAQPLSWMDRAKAFLCPHSQRAAKFNHVKSMMMLCLSIFQPCHENPLIIPQTINSNMFFYLTLGGETLYEYHNGVPPLINKLCQCNTERSREFLQDGVCALNLDQYCARTLWEAEEQWAKSWEYPLLSTATRDQKAAYAISSFVLYVRTCTTSVDEAQNLKDIELANKDLFDKYIERLKKEDIHVFTFSYPQKHCSLHKEKGYDMWYIPQKHLLTTLTTWERLNALYSIFTAIAASNVHQGVRRSIVYANRGFDKYTQTLKAKQIERVAQTRQRSNSF